MKQSSHFEVPTILTLFGITGDLVERKILAALFKLYVTGKLPAKFLVYGVSRRNWDDAELRSYLKNILEKKNLGTVAERTKFINIFFYVAGKFDDKKMYDQLGELLGRDDRDWRFCSNKLFYLAAPPPHYKTILRNLETSGLTEPCSAEEGFTRVILEKPFGTDKKNARDIDNLLMRLFKEEQIYRLDHYLGRETVRNIIGFRFSNAFLAPAWNNKSIESIEIKLLEKNSAQGRGEFYDAVGAFLDVGENHLLQLLALFIMDNPGNFRASLVRDKRAEALEMLPVLKKSEVMKNSARGQYEGFLDESGVRTNSKTETYFKLRFDIAGGKFKGVPVTLESGKGLDEDRAEIQVKFRHSTPCLCNSNEHLNNVLHYHLKPDESIKMRFYVKKPGYTYDLTREDFGFEYKQLKNIAARLTDYEGLILDIIEGDQTMFTSSREVEAEWKFAEPVVGAWRDNSENLATYKLNSKFSPELKDSSELLVNKKIGLVGFGKMGGKFAEQLLEKGFDVHGYNRSPEKVLALVSKGLRPAGSIGDLCRALPERKVVWVMLTAGSAVDEVLFGKDGLASCLKKGDYIIDGGNSFYEDTIRRGEKLKKLGINFVDVGFSGGPEGARHGACFMVGGTKEQFKELEPLFKAGAVPGGVEHFEGFGAGHFVKMVHNGIEYGMMQAIAEGFTILKKSKYKLDLTRVAEVYNNGSVVESRLVKWLGEAFKLYGADLSVISGAVDALGEGAWTVKTAHKLKIEDKVIHEAVNFRTHSKKHPSFMGQVVSAMRGQFGGHPVLRKKK